MTRAILAAILLVSGSLASLQAAGADRQAPESTRRSTPVGVGDAAPDFTLEDQTGRRHTLSAERGRRPVVLVFYRGYW